MATTTLVIGVILFAIGIVGQFRTKPEKAPAHPGDRNRARSVVMVASVVVGFWLVALSTVYVLYNHHHSQPQLTSAAAESN